MITYVLSEKIFVPWPRTSLISSLEVNLRENFYKTDLVEDSFPTLQCKLNLKSFVWSCERRINLFQSLTYSCLLNTPDVAPNIVMIMFAS